MNNRPELSKDLNSVTFKSFYYLKEELVDFCRREELQTTGGKIELTDRIAHYLDTGEKKMSSKSSIKPDIKSSSKLKGRVAGKVNKSCDITMESVIEDSFVCSEVHREFFKEKIGKSFKFNVEFQNWLKSNAGHTYQEAVEAYHNIIKEKKKGTTTIDRQFEYNTYIRDFFSNNSGRELKDAIRCWKYKKSLQGSNRYEETDLIVLEGN